MALEWSLVAVLATIALVSLGLLLRPMLRRVGERLLTEKATFSFRFGEAPPEAETAAPTRDLDPTRQAYYREAFAHAEAEFERAPDLAVREAHRHALELVKELGMPAARLTHVAASTLDPEQLLRSVDGIRSLMESTRAAARGIQQATAHQRADRDDLREAMALYRRMFDTLLPPSS